MVSRNKTNLQGKEFNLKRNASKSFMLELTIIDLFEKKIKQ